MVKKTPDRRSPRDRRLVAKPAAKPAPSKAAPSKSAASTKPAAKTAGTASKERRTPATKNRRDGAERRLAVRVPIDLWMEEVRGDEIYFRRSCNISEGGVFFEQSIPHPVGTKVTLRFSLPGTPHEVTVDGSVVSAAHVSGLGMGVKFTKLGAKDKDLLSTFIKETVKRRATATKPA